MPTKTQGEHVFDLEILVSGEAVKSFTATEALSAGEPVVVEGDRELSAAPDGGPATAVCGYDVSEGEETPAVFANGDNEVMVVVSEAVDDNAELTPDGLGTLRQTVEADDDLTLGITNEPAAAGEAVEIRLTEQSGVTA